MKHLLLTALLFVFSVSVSQTRSKEEQPQDFFKYYFLKDTLMPGEDYWAVIEIDTNRVKMSEVKVFFDEEEELPKRRNVYLLCWMAIPSASIDLVFKVKKGKTKYEFTKKYRFFVSRYDPKKNSTKDYQYTAAIMPWYSSAKFKTFDNYLDDKFKLSKPSYKGWMIVSYIIQKDGSVRFNKVEKGSPPAVDVGIIKYVFESCKDWVPADGDMHKEGKVNVIKYQVLVF